MDNFQQFIVTSRYCRWLEDKGRRETWDECVDRYFNYLHYRFPELQEESKVMDTLSGTVKDLKVFPSMRALMTAGPAADVDDVCTYNCSYLAIDRISSFSDVLYILCCGTGVGFSCEGKEVEKLPTIPETINRREDRYIVVEDSRVGWANAYRSLMKCLYDGVHPTWDTSLIRPAGARLKTFGGRSSGPAPLERLFRYIVNTFMKATGRKLTSLEVHDIVCLTGEVVIAGAVRRSALISLSDLYDREMAMAKSGPWWETSGHRSLANNSAVYETRPTLSNFMLEWSSLYDSHSGERGICNREAMATLAAKAGRETEDISFGTNPCSEIILRPQQFCNLTEVVIRPDDDLVTLSEKVRMATILGTIQSKFTNFTYLEDEWKDNCQEERLLGVSFTGVYDNTLMSGQEGLDKLRSTLTLLKEVAQETNIKWARKIGINPSKSITCCKPSGTTSCVANTSSGIHPRFSSYYIRRVRVDMKDPICQFMVDNEVPHEPCMMRPETTMIFSFPMKSPAGTITQKNLLAMDHLELWKEYQLHWCDHKPSATVSYTDDDFMAIGQWVWDNWDIVSGISFLPKNDHCYDQAPFEEIDIAAYHRLKQDMPISLNWDNLILYEQSDNTVATPTLACTGNSCEIVDLTEETDEPIRNYAN
jgi:ribonucleoside-triphosphate reductase